MLNTYYTKRACVIHKQYQCHYCCFCFIAIFVCLMLVVLYLPIINIPPNYYTSKMGWFQVWVFPNDDMPKNPSTNLETRGVFYALEGSTGFDKLPLSVSLGLVSGKLGLVHTHERYQSFRQFLHHRRTHKWLVYPGVVLSRIMVFVRPILAHRQLYHPDLFFRNRKVLGVVLATRLCWKCFTVSRHSSCFVQMPSFTMRNPTRQQNVPIINRAISEQSRQWCTSQKTSLFWAPFAYTAAPLL